MIGEKIKKNHVSIKISQDSFELLKELRSKYDLNSQQVIRRALSNVDKNPEIISTFINNKNDKKKRTYTPFQDNY